MWRPIRPSPRNQFIPFDVRGKYRTRYVRGAFRQVASEREQYVSTFLRARPQKHRTTSRSCWVAEEFEKYDLWARGRPIRCRRRHLMDIYRVVCELRIHILHLFIYDVGGTCVFSRIAWRYGWTR